MNKKSRRFRESIYRPYRKNERSEAFSPAGLHFDNVRRHLRIQEEPSAARFDDFSDFLDPSVDEKMVKIAGPTAQKMRRTRALIENSKKIFLLNYEQNLSFH